MNAKPSVLVSGGAGYIGSHTVWGLRERGVPTVVFDDLSTGSARLLPPDIQLVEGDVGDRALVCATLSKFDISAVMHFAGKILAAESVANPLLYYRENVVKTHALIDACVSAGVPHFIFSSSAAVYGEPETVPVNEDAPMHPMSPYGASKAMAERMLIDVSNAHRFAYVILRYFNVAGADALGRAGPLTPGATHLIKTACEVALSRRERLSVFGTDYPTPDGTCIRDYIHVSDLAEAHVLALKHLAGGGCSAVYNCGYGTGYSVLEVLRAVAAASGRALKFHYVARRPGDPAIVVADSSRIRRDLGWQPQLDNLDAIIKSSLAWEHRIAGLVPPITAISR